MYIISEMQQVSADPVIFNLSAEDKKLRAKNMNFEGALIVRLIENITNKSHR